MSEINEILRGSLSDVFLREQAKAKKMGQAEVRLSLPDKHCPPGEAELLDRLHRDGHKIQVIERDQFDHYKGRVLAVSTDPVTL